MVSFTGIRTEGTSSMKSKRMPRKKRRRRSEGAVVGGIARPRTVRDDAANVKLTRRRRVARLSAYQQGTLGAAYLRSAGVSSFCRGQRFCDSRPGRTQFVLEDGQVTNHPQVVKHGEGVNDEENGRDIGGKKHVHGEKGRHGS